MEDRVVDIDLRGTFDMKIVRGLTSAETEHVLCEVSARDASGYRTEKLGKDGWDVSHQEPMKNKVLLRFIREHLYPIPGLLEEMGFPTIPRWARSRPASPASSPKIRGMGQTASERADRQYGRQAQDAAGGSGGRRRAV